jgi:hypothetical protein
LENIRFLRNQKNALSFVRKKLQAKNGEVTVGKDCVHSITGGEAMHETGQL